MLKKQKKRGNATKSLQLAIKIKNAIERELIEKKTRFLVLFLFVATRLPVNGEMLQKYTQQPTTMMTVKEPSKKKSGEEKKKRQQRFISQCAFLNVLVNVFFFSFSLHFFFLPDCKVTEGRFSAGLGKKYI